MKRMGSASCLLATTQCGRAITTESVTAASLAGNPSYDRRPFPGTAASTFYCANHTNARTFSAAAY
jgi:hypothetical protein